MKTDSRDGFAYARKFQTYSLETTRPKPKYDTQHEGTERRISINVSKPFPNPGIHYDYKCRNLDRSSQSCGGLIDRPRRDNGNHFRGCKAAKAPGYRSNDRNGHTLNDFLTEDDRERKVMIH